MNIAIDKELIDHMISHYHQICTLLNERKSRAGEALGIVVNQENVVPTQRSDVRLEVEHNVNQSEDEPNLGTFLRL